jgi:alpha-beta hydrolase superfamily lysophospholipase
MTGQVSVAGPGCSTRRPLTQATWKVVVLDVMRFGLGSVAVSAALSWLALGGLTSGLAGCSSAIIQEPSSLDQRERSSAGVERSAKQTRTSSAPRISSRELPFSFERAGQHFGGTLSVPKRPTGARVPGIVIVHGSGPMSRDGTMPGQLGLGFGFDFPVYAELARELSRLGYAVARYDKRTCVGAGLCGSSKVVGAGTWSGFAEHETQVDDFVDDAKAAYEALVAHDFIDAERIVFVGHSQGAQLVPRLLTELQSVPAGVMLTPPYSSVPDLLREQGRLLIRVMRQAGKPNRVSEGYDLLRAARLLDALEDGRPTPSKILGQPLSLWRSWMRVSQEAPLLARALERPLLVVGGAYDYNVSPEELRLWTEWLMGSPHHVALLPCVTHALNCISESDPTQIQAGDIGRRIATDLVHELAAFLSSTLGGARTGNGFVPQMSMGNPVGGR